MSGGVSYRYTPQWTWRGGVAWDQTPVPDEFRTVRLPDSDRVWFTAGAQYKWSEALKFDVGAAYIWGSCLVAAGIAIALVVTGRPLLRKIAAERPHAAPPRPGSARPA